MVEFTKQTMELRMKASPHLLVQFIGNRMKNSEKQKALREEHKTRISIKSKGIKAFLKIR